mgnify:CR=1 FL=1
MDDELNIKRVSVSAIEDYFYCSLMFKLKHLYKLPYFPGSVKEAFHNAYKTALLKFFHEVGLANKPLRKCIAEAQELFVKKMRFALACFEKLDLSGEDLVAKGVLQLNDVHKLFAPDRDIIAAIDLPVTVNYKDIEIDYNIDALIVSNDQTLARKVRVLAVQDDFSDVALSARHDSLQFGLMKQSLSEHFMTGKKGLSFSEAKCEIIKVSGAKSATSTTHYSSSAEDHLSPLVDTAVKGMNNGIYLPTGQASKCNSCFFKDVCTAKLAGPDLTKKKHDYLTTKLNAKANRIASKGTQALG